jgi:hypothetical protein
MDSRLFIYTGNHGKQDGIEDYLTLCKNVFGSRGFQVEVSTTLHINSTNIIIDEFTNYIENKRIAAFSKDSPNNRCIYLLTEFKERKYGIESLNHFGGLFDSAIIALINVYLRKSRDDFPSLRFRNYVALLLYSPVLFIYFLFSVTNYIALKFLKKKASNPVAKFLRKQHKLIYFHMRYLGLKAHLKYADAAMSSHELIMQGYDEELGSDGKALKFLGVIYPEFNKQNVIKQLMIDKKLFFEITGTVTQYRKKWLKKINFQITLRGLNNIFGQCKALPFSVLASGKKIERAAFSLHPPQTRNWKYCSSMRIYRALEIDHNLPVLIKNFAQNPIENVCFLLKDWNSLGEVSELFFNREAMIGFVEPKIEAYNEIVKQHNNDLVEALKKRLNIC